MKLNLSGPSRNRPARTVRASTIEALEDRVAPATLSFGQHYNSGYFTSDAVATDSAGNVYVTGTFDSFLDLDPTASHFTVMTTAAGGTGSDVYIAKFSPTGGFLWGQSWGGISGSGTGGPEETPTDLAVDGSGNVYVLAQFNTAGAGFGGSGTLDALNGSNDTVLLKLNGNDGSPVVSFGNNGAVVWSGVGSENAGRLALDGAGSLYMTGSYDSSNPTLNGSTGYAAALGGDEVYVLKLNAATGFSDGQFGTNGLLHFGSAAPDLGGKPLPSGSFLYVEAFDNGNPYVLKLSSQFGTIIPTFGSSGRLDIMNLGDVTLDHAGRLLATGGTAAVGGYVKRFDPTAGNLDATFAGDGTLDLGTTMQFGQSIVLDSLDNVYVAGTRNADAAKPGQYFLLKASDAGVVDGSFGTNGSLFFAKTGSGLHNGLRMVVDTNDYLVLRGFFSGTTDIDPTKGTLTVTATTPPPTATHPDLDVFTVRLDPKGVDASNPVSFTDASGDVVNIAVAGTGSLRITPGTTPGVDIEKIETVDTDATTKIKIGLSKTSAGTTVIASIVTPGANQDLGSLSLGKNILLGDGVPGGDPALAITGKAGRLLLNDINPYSTIELGKGLAYLDTYTNQPNINVANILGDGVTIDVTGDGLPAGVGGGGLGRVVVNNWMGAGLIKTTQSVKSFKQKFGDCYVVFELDKDGVGAATKADMGSINIPNGAWGSSGSEIEGECGSFNCAAFLAGATISAANIHSMLVKNGPYAGTTTLTNPSSGGMGTFKVNSDYTGYVNSASSIKNIKVAGDFMGSLLAASIGSISAYSFDGTTTGDLYGDPLRHQIIAQAGSLGVIKTTGGGMKNFEVVVFTVFGGFKISTGSGTNVDVTGLDNVKLLAAEVGNISVSLKPATGSGPLTIVGIKDSVVESETTIGTITTSHSISGSLFAAATQMGNITVGSTSFPAEGVSTSMFLGGVNLGGDGAIDGDETFVHNGKIGNVTVKGTLLSTTIAAGVNPVDGIFGNGNDVAGAGPGLPATQKAIGNISIGLGSGTLTASPALTHNYVIEGQRIGTLKINAVTTPLTGLPKYLKVGGGEDMNDILVRTI